MTPFVLDASLAMSWCFADETTPYTQGVLAGLRTTYAVVPALWPFEITNVLAINERKRRITQEQSDAFLATLAALSIRVDPPIGAADLLVLTRKHGLTAYDASYLEVAIRTGLPIATLDKELLRASAQVNVNAVEIPGTYRM